MKTVSGSTNKILFKPNLCCQLSSFVKCPRCTWAICEECINKPKMLKFLRRNKYAMVGLVLFPLHPVCKCEGCNKDIHWEKANTNLLNWKGYPVYVCTPCINAGRVSVTDFMKVAKKYNETRNFKKSK